MLKWRRECPLLGRDAFLIGEDITWWEDNWDDDDSRFLAFSLHDRCAFRVFFRISFRAWGNQGAQQPGGIRQMLHSSASPCTTGARRSEGSAVSMCCADSCAAAASRLFARCHSVRCTRHFSGCSWLRRQLPLNPEICSLRPSFLDTSLPLSCRSSHRPQRCSRQCSGCNELTPSAASSEMQRPGRRRRVRGAERAPFRGASGAAAAAAGQPVGAPRGHRHGGPQGLHPRYAVLR